VSNYGPQGYCGLLQDIAGGTIAGGLGGAVIGGVPTGGVGAWPGFLYGALGTGLVTTLNEVRMGPGPLPVECK